MFRVILLITVFVCVSAGASKLSEPAANFEKSMHGVWAEFYTDDGKILSYMTYLPEGRFHAYGYLEDDVRSYWYADGLWKMIGDQSCIVFTFDSFGLTEKGESSCVTIISVTDTTLIYKDNQDNAINTLKRVSTGFLE